MNETFYESKEYVYLPFHLLGLILRMEVWELMRSGKDFASESASSFDGVEPVL
jgi:hypothetical protein